MPDESVPVPAMAASSLDLQGIQHDKETRTMAPRASDDEALRKLMHMDDRARRLLVKSVKSVGWGW